VTAAAAMDRPRSDDRTDRQRIEDAIPVRLCWHVARNLLDGVREQTDDADAVARMVGIVADVERVPDDALGPGLDDRHRAKLARRLYRAHDAIARDLIDRPVATALVVARELAAVLMDAGAWEPTAGYLRAWDAIADAVQDGGRNADLLAAEDRSGTRYGRKAARTLQALGYYAGAVLPGDAR
jgi:hypothetical protein